MDYDLSYIRNRVLNDKLDDTEFDPAVVDNFINDAQRSIFNDYELPFTEKVFIGTITQGQHMFEFPNDYQQVQSFTVTDPSDRQRNISHNYVPFRDFARWFPVVEGKTQGAPSMWTLHGNKLYFSNPLDQTYKLQMFYIKKATRLANNSDVPEIPEEFQELLILGAYYRILQRNEDYDLAAAVKVEYGTELNKMLNRLGMRQTAGITVMKQPRVNSRGR